MERLTSLLKEYIYNPEDSVITFNIAREYDRLGHTASAVTFYLKTAEFSDVDDFKYASLIMIGRCLSKQGDRSYTEKGCYIHAISVLPNRPEAYFLLSKLHEKHSEWSDCYLMACAGLNTKDSACIVDIDYPGVYAMHFQKALSMWWIGKTKECREYFQYIANNFKLDDEYKKHVQKNITSLGSGPNPFIPYNKSLHSNLKYQFLNSDKIQNNYSQTYQDMFILTMLNGKENGTYLEIGAADPFKGSNTALLEIDFNWKGISLEILPEEVEKFKKARKNPILLKDATLIDYNNLLLGLGYGTEIDYLQIDCEPPETTFNILLSIPFEKYKFGVITYEHDYYTDITKSYREKSRQFLKSHGYILVASNIAPDDSCAYEDWWVHPDLVDKKIINIMKDDSDYVKKADKYMLIKKV